MKELMTEFDSNEIEYKIHHKALDGSDGIIINDNRSGKDVEFMFSCDCYNDLFGRAQFGDYFDYKKAFSEIWSDDKSVDGMLDFYSNLNWNAYCDALQDRLEQTMEHFWTSKKEKGKPEIEKWECEVIIAAALWCKEVWNKVVKDKYQDYVKRIALA